MESIGTGLGDWVSSIDPEVAKRLKGAQNNKRFESAVRRTWLDNPLAADYVLAHINGLYLAVDDSPKTGAGKRGKSVVYGIYLDDSAAKAEIDARQETLRLALAKEGITFDAFRFHTATLGMRDRHAFPASVQAVNEALLGATPIPDSEPAPSSQTAAFKAEDEARLLQTFKTAVCLAMENIDHAQSFLDKIEGASMTQSTASAWKRKNRAFFCCRLYSSDPEPLRVIASNYEETIKSKAASLGLRLARIDIRKSTPSIRGQKAFPRLGMPISLQRASAEEPDDRA